MKVAMSEPYLDQEIEAKAIEVLRSKRYLNGPETKGFEADFAAYHGVQHAAAVNSATSAMHLALMALHVKPGDEVLVPSHTMFATVEPIVHLGAKPVFVEIDDTYTIDCADAAKKVTSRTVGIMPVHLYGHPANMDALHTLAKKHKLWIVEDCAQAHGALWSGKKVGTLSNAGCFSFFPSKNMTVAGDGGMVTSNDAALVETVRRLREHGRLDKNTHADVGFNMRLSELPAAIGRIQLKHLDEFVAARQAVAKRYGECLAGLPIVLPVEATGANHSYHLYVVRAESMQVRDELQAFLKAQDIETNVHYPVPCHLQPALAKHGFALPKGSLPKTESYTSTILSLPIYPTLSMEQQQHVIDSMKAFFKK